VDQEGAAAPVGGTLEAVACHIHRSNNQEAREVRIQDNLQEPHRLPLGVHNFRTDKACTQG